MLHLPIALAIGAIIPIQTAANSRLRQSVNNKPVVPALISFSIALMLSILATSVLVGNPLPQFAPGTETPWWIWLGGLMGSCFVLGNILLFPKLGAVQTVVLPILGQIIMGLSIDHFGLFHSPQVQVSALRILGALVVLAGIAVTLGVGRKNIAGDAEGAEVWLYRLIGIGVGMCSSIQAAVNGYLGTIAGSSLHAAEINLAVGAVLLLATVLVTSPKQLTRKVEPGPWWMWLGGVVGAIFVIGGATLVPVLGTATTVIAFNAGTIVGGQVMESVGAFGARKTPIDATRALGLAVIIVGVLAVRLL